MTQEEAAEIFDRIAFLLELNGYNPFKVRAYRSGAEILRGMGDLMGKAASGVLPKIPGLGEALRDKLGEMAMTGRLEFYEKLAAGVSPDIFELLDVPGLGAKKIKVMREVLGVESLLALKAGCEDGSVAKLPGFGVKTAVNLLKAVENRVAYAARHHVDGAGRLVKWITEWLRGQDGVIRVEAAGSWRRSRETVGDLDFLVSAKVPSILTEEFSKQVFVKEVLMCGPTKCSIRVDEGLQCDLRVVTDEQFPFALLYFTGSKEHNVAMRGRTLGLGFSLNEYGLKPEREGLEAPRIRTEGDMYRFLGVAEIPPELRENQGEWAAAEEGRIPKLICLEELRGTFHVHTRASDGRHTLREMADAARDLGLDYLGIADHSKSSFQANGLDEKRLLAQVEEIGELNRMYEDEGDRFRVLSGSEVDVLKDGSLDFSDEILARLDYTVASIHSSFTLSQVEMTRRIIRAMESPHVDMMGHLTGRLLLRREGYALDVPAVIEAAVETRTVIELNANPWRLDMDWRWWREAREAGVLCAINPDAHETMGLQHLFFGVRQARKGWLRTKDVLNTRKLSEIREWLGKSKIDRR